MVSHAWDEPIKDFVEAIESSGETGPFWICAMAIHQNSETDDDYIAEEITISQQLGPDPETGPFATVLKSVSLMIAVVTHVCDINTRLWCVYEMHIAVCRGVPVKLCAYISPMSLKYAALQKDICVASAEFSVDSSAARCGIPGQPQSSDEIMIRKVIDKSANGFNGVNQSVEQIRLSYLAKYPMNNVDYNTFYKSKAIIEIKKAIEYIIPRINVTNDLKTFDQYLESEKLNDDEDDEVKKFEAWLMYIQDKLILTK